jgi:hypothetical protein
MLGANLFGIPNVSQASLEPVFGSVGPLLFSHCNMVWRSFVHARGPGYKSFDSSWCFISATCHSSISARFLIYRAHAVCFCVLVAILDPPKLSILNAFLSPQMKSFSFVPQCNISSLPSF